MIRWKEHMSIIYIYGTLCFLSGLLVGCDGESKEQPITDSTEGHSVLESKEKGSETNEGEESNRVDKIHPNGSMEEDVESLTKYSSEQVEYARIWLQLGANQDIDELNVLHIPAGTPLNPNDATSRDYPEDVIQLAGSRLVDGSVTYSSNRNGSINVYNVPLRWDGIYPAGEEFYNGIIKNAKLVSVDPGDDEKVIELIKMQRVHTYK